MAEQRSVWFAVPWLENDGEIVDRDSAWSARPCPHGEEIEWGMFACLRLRRVELEMKDEKRVTHARGGEQWSVTENRHIHLLFVVDHFGFFWCYVDVQALGHRGRHLFLFADGDHL